MTAAAIAKPTTTVALNRSIHDKRTRAYLECRTSEGKTKREAMRALERHLSRSLYNGSSRSP